MAAKEKIEIAKELNIDEELQTNVNNDDMSELVEEGEIEHVYTKNHKAER